MAQELRPRGYGAGRGYEKKVWLRGYGSGAMAQELWLRGYGSEAMAQELRPRSYDSGALAQGL